MTEHEELVRRFKAAVAKQRGEIRFVHPSDKVSRRLPLPFRTRLRLRAHRRVDVVAGWLVGHGLERAAIGLWRVCGMWP